MDVPYHQHQWAKHGGHAPSRPTPELSSHTVAGRGTGAGVVEKLAFIGSSAALPSGPMATASDPPDPAALALPMKITYCVEVALPKAKSSWLPARCRHTWIVVLALIFLTHADTDVGAVTEIVSSGRASLHSDIETKPGGPML